jgi:hypothetical protein
MRITCWPALLVAGMSTQGWAAAPARWMMEADISGNRVEGTPLDYSEKNVSLLARDGRLWNFKPQDAKDFHQTTTHFQGYSAGEMRARLERELGSNYEVAATRHFVVAYPRSQPAPWAERFEDLYNSFIHYFSVRGFQPKEPEFPLVAIVWKRQEDFLRYTAQEGITPSRDVLGFYMPASNRITLYDVNGGKAGKNWTDNAETIIHEATHQTAFNTGIHNRFAPQPRWLAEGLATMFEAPGVWNSRTFTRQQDRINQGRFKQFQEYVATRRKPGSIQELVSSERVFDHDPAAAYAEAWALTFYLVETQPREYAKLLIRIAARPSFRAYTSAERLADFTAVFGDNFALLEAKLLGYMEELKSR